MRGDDPPRKSQNTETWLEPTTMAGAGQDRGGWRRAVLLLGALCVTLDLDAPQAGSRLPGRFSLAEGCLGKHPRSGSAQGSSPKL